MPLQIGTWKASVGGQNVQLNITNVSADGIINATLGPGGVGDTRYAGFWDEDSQRLCLISSPTENAGSPMFTGYLFTDPVNLTGVGGSVIFTLAGVVEYFGMPAGIPPGPEPTAKRSSFGWYAQIGVD
ncbi:MAG: hypothetical protein JOY69_07440 [Candidatus Eremiobacteraeota bacterium]|nr:hypothetical protein [Candidatus Eremiobacteraeota bacterium]